MLLGCQRSPPSPPPPDVEVTTVSPTDIPVFQEWIGTLDGFVNAQIRAQVTGYLLTQSYAEGSQVRKGDPLFRIDPRPFQAALDQAKSKLAQDRAQFGKTQLDVRRYTPLAREQAISKEELDNAEQANLAAEAQVKADEAAVKIARVNLDFTRVLSPMTNSPASRLRRSAISCRRARPSDHGVHRPPDQGLFPNQRAVVSEHGVARRPYKGRDIEHRAATDSFRRIGLSRARESLLRRSPDESQYRHAAVVGLFPNPKFHLAARPIRPDPRADRGETECPGPAPTSRDRASGRLSGRPRRRREQGPCRIGQGGRAGRLVWIIEAGLKPGDRVVVEGLQKAKDGKVVNPTPFRETVRQPPTLGAADPIPGHRRAN